MNQLKHLKIILLFIFIILMFITVLSIRRDEGESEKPETPFSVISQAESSEPYLTGNVINEITDGKRELVSNGKVFAVVSFDKCIENTEGQMVFIKPDIELSKYKSHFNSEKAVMKDGKINMSGNISFINSENNLRLIMSEPVTFHNDIIYGKESIQAIFDKDYVLSGTDFSLDLNKNILRIKNKSHFDSLGKHFRISSEQSVIDYRNKVFIFLKNVLLDKEKTDASEQIHVKSFTASYKPGNNHLTMTGFVNMEVSSFMIRSVELDIYPDNESVNINSSSPVYCETDRAIIVSDSMAGDDAQMTFYETILTDGLNRLSINKFSLNLNKNRGSGMYPYFLNKKFNIFSESLEINMITGILKLSSPELYSIENGMFLESRIGFIHDSGEAEMQENVAGLSTEYSIFSDSLKKRDNELVCTNCTIENHMNDTELNANKIFIENNQIKASGKVTAYDSQKQISVHSDFATFRKNSIFFSGDVNILQNSNSISCGLYLYENNINIFTDGFIEYSTGMKGKAHVIVQNPYSDLTRFYRNVEIFDKKGNLARGDSLTLNKATDKIQVIGKTEKAKADFFYDK